MPSAKFTESEVLEPSESFLERKKISEVEADLRAYFAWEKGKPLPGWIYDKLKKYPLLTEHTIKFLHWLRSQPATNKCKAKTCSLYDIMVDCMITDLLMSALQRFETQYRLNEYNARPTLQASDSTAPAIKSASYFRWLYPENPTRHLKLSNLKREPLSRYYYASDGSFLPCTLDTEFLQVITSMHSCDFQKRISSIFCSHFVFFHLCVITRILFIRLKNTSVTIRCIPHETSMLFLRSMSCSLPFSITTDISLNSFKRTYVKPEIQSAAASNSWHAQDRLFEHSPISPIC